MISKVHAAQFIKNKYQHSCKAGTLLHCGVMTAVVHLNATCGWNVYRAPANVPLDCQLTGNLAELLGEFGANVDYPTIVSILRAIATAIVPVEPPIAVRVDDPSGPAGVRQRAFDTLCLMYSPGDIPADTADRFLGLIGCREVQPATFLQTTKLVNNFEADGERAIACICGWVKFWKLQFRD